MTTSTSERLPLDVPAITAWTRQTHRAREMYRALPITRLHGGAVTVAHCCCWTCRRKP